MHNRVVKKWNKIIVFISPKNNFKMIQIDTIFVLKNIIIIIFE
jgi:hypothetical protein